MSKDITINVNGVAQNFSGVNHVITSSSDGSARFWDAYDMPDFPSVDIPSAKSVVITSDGGSFYSGSKYEFWCDGNGYFCVYISQDEQTAEVLFVSPQKTSYHVRVSEQAHATDPWVVKSEREYTIARNEEYLGKTVWFSGGYSIYIDRGLRLDTPMGTVPFPILYEPTEMQKAAPLAWKMIYGDPVNNDELKDVAVQEGGKTYGFLANMLKIPKQGGGSSFWVSRKFDIISSIRVTNAPTKVNYIEGETIDYTGIVVHCYNENGDDLFAIPFEQLVLPVTTAEGAEWTNGAGLNAQMIKYVPKMNRAEWVKIYPGRVDEEQVFVSDVVLGEHGNHPSTFGGHGTATLLATKYYRNDWGKEANYLAAIDGDTYANLYDFFDHELTDSGQIYRDGWFATGGSGATAGTKKFSTVSWEEYLTNMPISTVDPEKVDITTLTSTQQIPVKWRPNGEKILETSFYITLSTE